MQRSRVLASIATAGLGLSLVAATPAFAVHESNNKVDFAPVAAGSPADAIGHSNVTGSGWVNRVRATDLAPATTYTWVGIAGGTASSICSFTTDAEGNGGCTSDVNSRLGATEIRLGTVSGSAVLRATGCTTTSPGDADNQVDDGEIERRGAARTADADCPTA